MLFERLNGMTTGTVTAIIASMAMFGAFVASSLSDATQRVTQQATSLTTTNILLQASAIHDGLVNLKHANPKIKSVDEISLDDAEPSYGMFENSVGLFNLSSGGMEPLAPPASAFVSGSKQWKKTTDEALNPSGSTYLYLDELTSSQCQQINDTLGVPVEERAAGMTNRGKFCDENTRTFYSVVLEG